MCRALPAVLFWLIVSLPGPGASAAEPPARRFAVHAAHWVDVRAGTARGPVWVVISGDTIESIATSAPAGL